MVFHWSLSNNKSPQVFKTLLSILADLSNAVVWIVSTRPLISESSKSLYQSFGDCDKDTNYNGYHRQFPFPRLFQFPNKVEVLILLFTFFHFYSVQGQQSPQFCKFSFFCWLLYAPVVWPRSGDAWWLERSSMARETWVQSQVESYQRLKNGTWCLLD